MELNYDEEEWWVSEMHPYAIVSNFLTGHDDRGNITSYGGHLVAESIIDPKIRAKILAVPELLRAIEEVLKPYTNDTTEVNINPAMGRLRSAYNQAMGCKHVTDGSEFTAFNEDVRLAT